MTPVKKLYILYYEDPEAYIIPNTAWMDSVLGDIYCRGCWTLDRSRYPKPVDVFVERFSSRNPIGFVDRVCMGVIRNDLRALLEPWTTKFTFGNCFDDDGRHIATHSTFYSSDYVIKRMGPGSVYWQCNLCGVISSRRGGSRSYFLSYDVGDLKIMHTRYCSTLVTEEILRQVDLTKVPGLAIGEYPLFDRPIDGVRFPNDREDVQGEPPPIRDFRKKYRD
jgi:hypothetical protein